MSDLEFNAIPKIKMRKYSHPTWDMALFTEEKDGDQIALDMLGGGNGDPGLLAFTECEMTREEIEALPEFDR